MTAREMKKDEGKQSAVPKGAATGKTYVDALRAAMNTQELAARLEYVTAKMRREVPVDVNQRKERVGR